MKIDKIKLCSWNPRKMDSASKKALKASIKEFSDISGITVNSRTGNLLSGNHRWQELVSEHGKDNLALENIKGEFYALNSKGEFTGFIVRIVDWPIDKEKAANITANSDLVSGEFTSGLQDVLSSISDSYAGSVFTELRLDDLHIDFDELDDYLDLEDNTGTIQEQSEKRNNELESARGDEIDGVKDIRSLVKISMPSELRDEIKNDLMEFLSKKKYYNDITIV